MCHNRNKMYWLGYAAVLIGAISIASFKRMTPEDRQAFFKKIGL